MGLFDKLKDVVADIAPVVLPVAINAFLPGLGTVASSALGAGIGTLLRGGDAEDALKSAALGGGIGALSVGMAPGKDSFGKKLAADFDTTKGFFSRPLSQSASTLVGGQQQPFNYQDLTETTAPSELVSKQPEYTQKALTKAITDSGKGITELQEPSMFKGPFQKGYTDTELMSSPEFRALKGEGFTAKEALEKLSSTYNPSFMDKYGLIGTAGIGALLLDEEPEEDGEDVETGADIYLRDPDRYQIDVSTAPIPTMADIVVPYSRNFKEGGEVAFFPRRNGGIGPGEGSGTKDDVPAMLMDGEFVMTRNAVKAAGGGSINKGIDNMYSLMRNLEARA